MHGRQFELGLAKLCDYFAEIPVIDSAKICILKRRFQFQQIAVL